MRETAPASEGDVMPAKESVRRKSTVRFRLWHLLVLMLLLSPPLAWYANRMHYVRSETQAIAGDWVMVDEQGQPVTDVAGATLHFRLRPGDFVVYPRSDPRKIDFQGAQGRRGRSTAGKMACYTSSNRQMASHGPRPLPIRSATLKERRLHPWMSRGTPTFCNERRSDLAH